MAIMFWIVLVIATTALFIWLWRFATQIELQEYEERQWSEWTTQMAQAYPEFAWYYHKMFEDKFLK